MKREMKFAIDGVRLSEMDSNSIYLTFDICETARVYPLSLRKAYLRDEALYVEASSKAPFRTYIGKMIYWAESEERKDDGKAFTVYSGDNVVRRGPKRDTLLDAGQFLFIVSGNANHIDTTDLMKSAKLKDGSLSEIKTLAKRWSGRNRRNYDKENSPYRNVQCY